MAKKFKLKKFDIPQGYKIKEMFTNGKNGVLFLSKKRKKR